MACRVYEVQEIGLNRQALIFGEVQRLYLDDAAAGQDARGRLKVDAGVLDPIGRLGANEYTTFGEIINIPRPK